MYEMTYGPCIKVIPVGIHCQLLHQYRKSSYVLIDSHMSGKGSDKSSGKGMRNTTSVDRMR
jgi:hypothetical protein